MNKSWGSLSRAVAAIPKKTAPKKGRKRVTTDPLKVPVVMEPEERKRKKREDVLKYRDAIRARKMISEFPGHGLVERDGLLMCTFCDGYISFKEKANVRQHCLGYRTKGGVRTKAKVHRHTLNMQEAAQREAKKTLMDRKVDEFQAAIWAESSGAASAVGSTLPSRSITNRVEIVQALWSSGIPLAKLRNPAFLELVESAHPSTGGYSQIVAQQAIAVQLAMDHVRACVQNRQVSITADGSKVNFTVEAMLARFVSDPPELMPHYLYWGFNSTHESDCRDSFFDFSQPHSESWHRDAKCSWSDY